MVRYKLIEVQAPQKLIQKGDVVTNFRQEGWILDSFSPSTGSGYGKVHVHEPGDERNVREFNASVFGLIVVEDGVTEDKPNVEVTEVK